MRTLLLGAALAMAAGAASAAIKEDPVTYRAGDLTMKGFVVYDDAAAGRRPGVVVVPEWWGITKHSHEEARKLAGQGYTAFIADMYGDGKTADNPKDAGALSGAVMKDNAAMQARFNAAKDALAKHSTVDGSRIAAIGFCFGGAVVLNMARAGSDMKGVVSFHGGLGANGAQAAPGTVRAKVMVHNGADDPFVKPEAIAAFRKEFDAAKVDYRFVDHPGAVHAFTNPEATEKGRQFNLPLAYHFGADRLSKEQAYAFLADVLKK